MKIGISCMLILLIGGGYGCAPQKDPNIAEQAYLKEQEQQQGYPVLIATPQSADYGLPFCEKAYCIDVEIFSFKSEDTWFNEVVNQQIADLIRKELGIKQKLSLQTAVNEFVRRSDQWQETKKGEAWSVHIQPRVVHQQGAMTVTQIQAEYKLGDTIVPSQSYYFVVDRKIQKIISLYDMVKESKRVTFGLYIQKEYEKWLENQLDKQYSKPQIYWASQDWFFDDQGIGVFYRAEDLSLQNKTKVKNNFTVYISNGNIKEWLDKKYLTNMGFLN